MAIKTFNHKADEKERVKFLQEAAIMGQFRHPNVITLHGVVTVGEPVNRENHSFSYLANHLLLDLLLSCLQVMIVLELMENGDLEQHLLSLRQHLHSHKSVYVLLCPILVLLLFNIITNIIMHV